MAAGAGQTPGDSTKHPTKRQVSGLATAYLVIYNVVLCAGWTAVGVMGMRHYLQSKSHIGVYDAVEIPLKVFQTAAILEVVHCAIGIVPTSVMLTGFQVVSRLLLVWPIVHAVPQVQNELSVILFLLAWTTTEVMRYAFYTLGLLNRLPYALTWSRYTFFIVLYPIGVTGELLTIYAALPHVKESGLFSVTLPNNLNVSFDYWSFLIVIMCTYIPIFPRLYSHMIRQRKKVIGGVTTKKQD
ncbi:very-long-chain (3R)-3-hydroxyacyl-CoA dehydratase 2-like [Asterias rubens]|uniref:very-long-chain (3R)-3-hydroxyacyl-CoA dehydratase 2-like n=1 Tax=Asterias rubens TaxID=7604 RepID=UPI0014551FE6|nr:very-long-chain (3R)-3-hydroxyacyl-CoA dehydratase 2-like [Asterias rubens]